jgi:hypothetical protein
MNIFSVEDILDCIREDYPTIDFSQRKPSVLRWIKDALSTIAGVDSLWYYYGGIPVQVSENIGQLPSNVERLLNVYKSNGTSYQPITFKLVGDKVQVHESCDIIHINYYGTEAEIKAYTLAQRDYAMFYSIERLMQDDIYAGQTNIPFYQMIVQKRDETKRMASKERIPSWDEIAGAISAFKYGKFSMDARHPRNNFQ